MLRICICDDEPVLCLEIKDMLQRYIGKQELEVFEIYSIAELLENARPYDVLFLDIRFNGEDAGIEAAKQLRRQGNEAVLIFLTSLSRYATNGYEADAFRYLLKPIKTDMLTATMDAVIAKIESQHFRISVVSGAGTVIIEAADIRYIESVARRRVIHTDNQKIETWETMAELYAKLPTGWFVYIQKGYVSNLDFIEQIKSNVVTLKSGEQIALGRNYKNDFFIAFNRHVRAGRW